MSDGVPEIPLFVPYLGDEVRRAALDAIDGGWIGPGPLTARFEESIAARLGGERRRVVATSSGTAALHTASIVAGLGPGDEVIIPSFDYVAGHQAASASGADLVFCDVDPLTWGADPESVRRLVSPRTKAIVVVHFAGVRAAGTDAILELARARGLRVIEDAAHAFGTVTAAGAVGSHGDLTCFSFGPVKIVTSLEGGALVLGDEQEEAVAREVRVLGLDADLSARYQRARSVQYDVLRQGYRYHLGSVPASIGLAQLALLDSFIESRRRACLHYDQAFAGIDGLRTPATDWVGVSPFEYVLQVEDEETRDLFIKHLTSSGVGAGKTWIGGHETTFYGSCRRDDLAVTEAVSRTGVIIPLHSLMGSDVLHRVSDVVRSFFD